MNLSNQPLKNTLIIVESKNTLSTIIPIEPVYTYIRSVRALYLGCPLIGGQISTPMKLQQLYISGILMWTISLYLYDSLLVSVN